jgi:CheY-like chemotaxis protein
MKLPVIKIISGGQTGADRAGLDWAIRSDLEHGGWCPKGRVAEDGPIPDRYRLQETPDADYLQRTEWNVRDSDGTVIFSVARQLFGGSLTTREFAASHQKPCLHLSAGSANDAAAALLKWLRQNQIRALNIAGPRASEEPGVAEFVTATLDAALTPVLVYVVDHPEVLATYEMVFKHHADHLPICRIKTFADPDDALRHFTVANPRPFLLITSYLLQSASGLSMNGIELLQKCREIKPTLKVLLTSAITTGEIVAALEKAAVRPDAWIKKPFAVEEFAKLLEDLLRSARPHPPLKPSNN